MTKPELNPDSITLEDVQGMSAREFRQWDFLKINAMSRDIKKLDHRQWAALTGAWVAAIGMLATLIAVLL